jgi:hypothetical protein
LEPIEAALAAIESLDPRENINYTQIAKSYSVVRSTLTQRHQRISSSRDTKAQNQQALHPQQEQELLRYIERLTSQGLPPTRPMIRRFASDITKKEVGVRWVDRFIARHEVDLISRWATGIGRPRHQADSISKYTLYFSLLHEKMSKYDVKARNTYNMD